MPFQHLRKEAKSPVFLRPRGLVRWEQREEPSHYCAYLCKAGTQFLRGLTGLGRRSWQFTTALGSQFLAPIFKPIPQPQRRQAVVPIVAFDGLQKIADFS